jgi:L-alanine-DL-glutamate epimerase-like enolase superfamily enzyme
MKVAHMAEAHNLPVTSHGIHDVHVHLLAAVPNSSYLEEHGFGIEKFMTKPLVVEDGMAIASDTPGHGVALDKEKLGPYLVED